MTHSLRVIIALIDETFMATSELKQSGSITKVRSALIAARTNAIAEMEFALKVEVQEEVKRLQDSQQELFSGHQTADRSA